MGTVQNSFHAVPMNWIISVTHEYFLIKKTSLKKKHHMRDNIIPHSI